ncbi:MAG: YceD family protein [Sphingosinicella sp.]|uniref:YceD family protein n=1 Tax=Sphingosinicella sp. TaxID=1917971 RepID=UPI004037E58E
MTAPEFSRPVPLDTIGEAPRRVAIEADEAERAVLAARFGLVAIDRLAAEAELVRTGTDVAATGRIEAAVTQACVATGAPVEARIDEPFSIRFQPLPESGPDEEIELGENELDVTFYEGGAIDLGEAAAETLALALDPYPRSPDAETALKQAGVQSEEEAGPFGALAALRGKLGK